MMFKKSILLPIVLLTGFSMFFSSCVSMKKYKEAEDRISSLNRTQRELRADLEAANSRIDLMEQANLDALNQIANKDKMIDSVQSELNMYSSALEDQHKTLVQLQGMIDRQKAQTELLRQKMTEALGGFSNDQLSVYTKDGKVYVSLSEKLLFPSGSANVNQEGKEALEILANALQEQPDIHINIEGHTDSIPIKVRYEDNWALSVARSTAIVRMLTNDFNIDPIRIIASGKSQYDPIADNSTEEGRAKNRRTEIILAPKLDQLMEILNYDQD